VAVTATGRTAGASTPRRDLAKTRSRRHRTAARSGAAISTANRELHRLAERQHATDGRLRELESQSRRLAEQGAARQRQLSRLLYRHFTRGEGDALSLLLKRIEQAALEHQFRKRLSAAQAEVIADLRDKAREKQRLGELARRKGEDLAAIEQERKQARASLVEQQGQRRQLLARTADRIKARQRKSARCGGTRTATGDADRYARQSARRLFAPRLPGAKEAPSRLETDDAPAIPPAQQADCRCAAAVALAPEGRRRRKGLFTARRRHEVRGSGGGQVVHADRLRMAI
jgi:septal ring factor EnvC (AmiA/AmiB activator)